MFGRIKVWYPVDDFGGVAQYTIKRKLYDVGYDLKGNVIIATIWYHSRWLVAIVENDKLTAYFDRECECPNEYEFGGE